MNRQSSFAGNKPAIPLRPIDFQELARRPASPLSRSEARRIILEMLG